MSMRGSPPVLIDPTAAALPARERLERWMSTQRVFISSAMSDTMDERAAAVQSSGAQAVWFEEFTVASSRAPGCRLRPVADGMKPVDAPCVTRNGLPGATPGWAP